MQLDYLYHFDEDEVERVLRSAEALVDKCDLDPELRRTAFEKAIDLLSNKVATGVSGSAVLPANALPRL